MTPCCHVSSYSFSLFLCLCRLTFTVVFLQDTGEASLTQRGNFSLVECWQTLSYSNDLEPGIGLDTHTCSCTLTQSQAKETVFFFFFSFFRVFAQLQNSGFCSQMWTVNIKPSICKLYPRNRQDKEKECAKTHMWLSILLSWHLDFTVVNVVFLLLTKAAKMTSISALKNLFSCH